MAIFGRAEFLLPGGETLLLREGNNWDVFLNYFFAVIFIFCFVLGIFLQPFIVAYHAQQKKTFANFLFLLISSMDLFKSLYFPVIMVPKLLSPLGEKDYYFIVDVGSNSISWTAYSNCFFISIAWAEMLILVVLNAARYFSVTRPLSSSRKRNVVFFVAVILSFLHRIFEFLNASFITKTSFSRIFYSAVTQEVGGPNMIVEAIFFCSSTIAGGVFIILTVSVLGNSDGASSEVSNQNIRRGIRSLIAMSVFNVFLLLCSVCYFSVMFLANNFGWDFFKDSRLLVDLIQFFICYGLPLSQSVFNSMSILFICKSFKDFLKPFWRGRRMGVCTNA